MGSLNLPLLELKIPPPVIALLVACAMWGIAALAPGLELPALIRMVTAVTVALTGIGFGVAGIVSFRQAKTTVNPHKPMTTTALVCTGIYKFTRNPMYLGLAFFLVAWAVFLSSAWALLGLPAFIFYLNRFQIAPEERVLSTKFGADYSAYQSKVRRWL